LAGFIFIISAPVAVIALVSGASNNPTDSDYSFPQKFYFVLKLS